jgi:hypothetical protein
VSDASEPRQRAAPFSFPETFELPERPDKPPQAADAWRQTQFSLKSDLNLLKWGMELQLGLVRAAYPSPRRSLTMSAVLSFWSRAWMAEGDAISLAARGSYASAFSLLRPAADAIGAQQEMLETDAAEWKEWLARGLRQDAAHKAWEFELGLFRSGGAMSRNADAGFVFRVASDFAMPNLGATLLLTGAESNLQRVMVGFADQSFHAGWAELVFGLTLRAQRAQVNLISEHRDRIDWNEALEAAVGEFNEKVDGVLGGSARCRAEELDEATGRRLLVHNFRRQLSGAPRKILL